MEMVFETKMWRKEDFVYGIIAMLEERGLLESFEQRMDCAVMVYRGFVGGSRLSTVLHEVFWFIDVNIVNEMHNKINSEIG